MELDTELRGLLAERILLLDGAMGTMIQTRELDEAAFRGARFRDHPCDLRGNNDLLTLTQPDLIAAIHAEMLAAGADILETNTFNATRIAMADYQLEEAVYELNQVGAELAKAEAVKASTPDKPRFVAGVLGPTNRTASISPDVNDPGARNVTFEELVATYAEATRGLLDGGADLLLIETIFDTLNAKAAIFAVLEEFERRGGRAPIMISGTITDNSGRTLTGQTAEAFWRSVEHAEPLTVGLNCALGGAKLRPYVEELARSADIFVSTHPNAGLPNEFGKYDETPEEMAEVLGAMARDGLVNLVGGCCGSTPAHIHAIAEAVRGVRPRTRPEPEPMLGLSGLKPFTLTPDTNFVNVGERCNVTGSRRFLRLIKEESYEEALEVARRQVDDGAQILDINMDEGLLDSAAVMRTFLNLAMSEPEIAQVPIMVDSSKWEVIEAGLRCVQGKCVVNSISLKEGEEPFIAQAKSDPALRSGGGGHGIRRTRAGRHLSRTRPREHLRTGLPQSWWTVARVSALEDIIFDPNILDGRPPGSRSTTTTRSTSSRPRQMDQGARCPHASVFPWESPTFPFSFRGNNVVREAMHSVFLYHATRAGMDMGIVNAGHAGGL